MRHRVQRISFLVQLRVVSACAAGSMIASFDVRNVPDVARLTECTLDRPLSPITNDGIESVNNRRRDKNMDTRRSVRRFPWLQTRAG
jgi:hypothetical protein